MGMLATAAKRLTGLDVRQPACPVRARDGYRTMVFSLHDQTPAPTPRLMRTALDAIRLVIEGNADLKDIAAGRAAPEWFDLWPGEHYRLLAAFVQLLRPKVVIEIGTFAGLSALAMKKYLPADGRIITFDICAWDKVSETNLRPDDFADGRLEQRLEDLSDEKAIERNRDVLEAADFFLIDAPKDGVFEYRLVEHFQSRLKFKNRPIALFDDTRLWPMLRFWRTLPYPKLDITSFGSWSGSGLVELL